MSFAQLKPHFEIECGPSEWEGLEGTLCPRCGEELVSEVRPGSRGYGEVERRSCECGFAVLYRNGKRFWTPSDG